MSKEKDRFISLHVEIRNLLTNLKENPKGKSCSKDYAKIKLKIENYHAEYNQLYKQIKTILPNGETLKKLHSLKEEEEKSYQEIFSILSKTNTNTMEQWDSESASNNIPDFLGDKKDLANFLSIVSYYNKKLSREEQRKLIEFVVCVKLKGKAKSAVAFKDIKHFEELQEELLARFGERKTIESINNELRNIKQKNNQKVEDFAEKVEELVNTLSELQMAQEKPKDASLIRKLNDTTAVSVFKAGVSAEIKTILMASRVSTFTDAVNLAIEVESTVEEKKSQVNSGQSTSRGSNRGSSGRGNNYRGQGQRGNFNNYRGTGRGNFYIDRGTGRGNSHGNQRGSGRHNRENYQEMEEKLGWLREFLG